MADAASVPSEAALVGRPPHDPDGYDDHTCCLRCALDREVDYRDERDDLHCRITRTIEYVDGLLVLGNLAPAERVVCQSVRDSLTTPCGPKQTARSTVEEADRG